MRSLDEASVSRGRLSGSSRQRLTQCLR
jgi:hypothetical protein